METSCPEGPGARPRTVTKFSEYVGSFPVKETDSRRRVWIIEEQMRFLKDCPRRRAVILKFCQQGVKMYEADGATLLMAHALRRIQYTTCRPEDRQFAFVSRNPQRSSSHLFCHLFVGQAGEAQALNLLLCRSFQLQYLAEHPEAEDVTTRTAATKGVSGGVRREPLDPGAVTQNVNALVSFRRLPGAGEDSPTRSQIEASEGTKLPCSSSSDAPYCSPTLVRKKAIRSKVIRCGAYRCPNYESQLREGLKPETTGRAGRAPRELSERPEVLADAVWFCAGIDRDSSLSLLKEDRMGAFVLRPDPGCSGHFTLYMSTQCGVIPYQIYANQKAKYCFEHLPQEFPSLAALIEHHTGADGSLFFQLAHGRVNPCYEAEDPQCSPNPPREAAAEPGGQAEEAEECSPNPPREVAAEPGGQEEEEDPQCSPNPPREAEEAAEPGGQEEEAAEECSQRPDDEEPQPEAAPTELTI